MKARYGIHNQSPSSFVSSFFPLVAGWAAIISHILNPTRERAMGNETNEGASPARNKLDLGAEADNDRNQNEGGGQSEHLELVVKASGGDIVRFKVK